MKNIILIGMPGCGKTTIGKKLSEELGFKFIDLDEYVEKKNSMTIPDMFKVSEEFFRLKETEAVIDMKSYENCIISTGGGVVKNNKNMEILKQCGKVIFINRDTDKIVKTLDSSSRPLLKDGKDKIFKIYEERINLYNLYCDVKIDNNEEIIDVLNTLKKIILNLDI